MSAYNMENPCFRMISLSDREWFRQLLQQESWEHNFAFGTEFVWRDAYRERVAQIGACGIVEMTVNGSLCYSFPFGGNDDDKINAVSVMSEYCRSLGTVLCLTPITREQKALLDKAFHGRFECRDLRSMYDYIYTAERLKSLAGRDLSAKRNHIGHFLRKYPDWTYETMSSQNAAECLEYEEKWMLEREPSEDLAEEENAIRYALTHFEELGFCGGLLRVGGKIVAFTIGERLNSDVMIVHFEKAETSVDGAYPMINREFVAHECEDVRYVNREDDAGLEGLRHAKMSYKPDHLAVKYVAVEGRYAFATKEDFSDLMPLWQEAFGDSREYIEGFLTAHAEEDNRIICRFRDGKPVTMASLFPLAADEPAESGKPVESGKSAETGNPAESGNPAETGNPAESRKTGDGSEHDGTDPHAVYVYALATHPSERGQGFGRELLLHLKDLGYSGILVQPEQNGVDGWYRRLGFRELSAERFEAIRQANGLQELSEPGIGGMFYDLDAE